MRTVVCGLGYVGSTVAACLVEARHDVTGIDIDPWKVERVAAGVSPVAEPRISELLTRGMRAGRLRAARAIDRHLDNADIVFVCVSTPTAADGGLDLRAIGAATAEIGRAIRNRPTGMRPLLVVYRSTLPPRTMEDFVIPLLVEHAGAEPGPTYEPVFNPEFLREASAIEDFLAPSRIVIGERYRGASQRLYGIYEKIDAPVFELSFRAAEMIKMCDNSFHALKVAYGNEVGRVCIDAGIDPDEVIEAFLADRKLNISTAYLRPGSPFGGSCLPKDLRAMIRLAQVHGTNVPVMRSTLESNDVHKDYMFERVRSATWSGARILLMGLSFKPNTDDLRESPYVDLAASLLAAGYELRIYDPLIDERLVHGLNRHYLESRLPGIKSLMVQDPAAIEEIDLIVMAHSDDSMLRRLDPMIPRINVGRIDRSLVRADRITMPFGETADAPAE
ncbi:MAG: nucleotide sugar dehydrogenase [Alphaproteobacteria bacterium]|nr:nucleotide sugar dehydrogenase [Alphaproteobacteria bacterium]